MQTVLDNLSQWRSAKISAPGVCSCRKQDAIAPIRIHPAAVGDLTLMRQTMELTVDAGLSIIALTAAPGSPSQDAFGRPERDNHPVNVS